MEKSGKFESFLVMFNLYISSISIYVRPNFEQRGDGKIISNIEGVLKSQF